jgi:hypothetical protein
VETSTDGTITTTYNGHLLSGDVYVGAVLNAAALGAWLMTKPQQQL